MLSSDLHYHLPPERIAQMPADRRDESRLLVLDRRTGQRRHEQFARLVCLLPPRALLVLNDTRVLPARLTLRRRTGGRVQALFLRCDPEGVWELMLTGSGRLRPGEDLLLQDSSYRLRLRARRDAGVWAAVPEPPVEPGELLSQYGRTPLPPYIARDATTSAEQAAADVERYQTIYARSGGAIAAPTAGLHFTPEVFASLQTVGIETAYVTLHVGVGTFAPIRCEDLRDHVMHAEWYDLPAPTAAMVNAARAVGRPIIAVGTTSTRVLESCADEAGRVTAGTGWTRLFIYPPYRFRTVDGMLTNFHLPGSTLLAMIFALAGREAVLAAYNEAIAREYRFYSYGDAMLIV